MWADLPFDLFLAVSARLGVADLAACCRVCARWRTMADDDLVWRRRQPRPRSEPACWKTYSVMVAKERNLVANPNGGDGMARWAVKNSYYSRWDPMVIAKGSRPECSAVSNSIINTCFTSTYGKCALFQTIDLCSAGYSANLLDRTCPDIAVSFMYADKRYIYCHYRYCVELISEDMKVLDRFCAYAKFQKIKCYSWHHVKHVFRDYPPGARYVHISHTSKCRIGMAGITVTGHRVTVQYPLRNMAGGSTSDLQVLFDGVQPVNMVTCGQPRAPYRCVICFTLDCSDVACLRYRCGLDRCRVNANVVNRRIRCYAAAGSCLCWFCSKPQCDCVDCKHFMLYYLKCDCSACEQIKNKCACVGCKCVTCNTSLCPCTPCAPSKYAYIGKYHDIRYRYIRYYCNTY
ncbi:putative F-box-containing protein [Namao virus]|nr:putative F-box-containing protein [Namao virus]